MQLQEMQAALRLRIGNPLADEVSDGELRSHLNSSLLDIADRFRFHKARRVCRFNTVQSQSRYDLPSNLTAILRAQDVTSFRKLEKVGDRQYSSRSDDNEGQPAQYVRYRDYIQLIPVPDGIYMAAATDVPGLPPSWHMGIVLRARWYYYDARSDNPKKIEALESFRLWAQDKPTEIDEESVDIDSGVEIPTLTSSNQPRLDFDHSE
jgi:hypothetical protein